MPRYEVVLKTVGNFPIEQSLSPISIGNDINLVLENDGWKVRLESEADNVRAALELSKGRANDSLMLLQMFSAGAVSPFSLQVPEDAGGYVENLASHEGMAFSETAKVTAYARAVVTNVNQFRTNLNQLPEVWPLTSEDDCKIIMYYYTMGLREEKSTYRFLNLIAAVEAMLSERSETTEKVSRRLALLVSSKFADMQQTYEQFKGFYNTRSDILHGERIPQLSQEAVNVLAELTRVAFRNFLLLRNHHNRQQIKELLDKFLDKNTVNQIQRMTAF